MKAASPVSVATLLAIFFASSGQLTVPLSAQSSSAVPPAEAHPQAEPVFQITPLKPVAELRSEALASKPPVEAGPFLPTDLIEVTRLDPTVKLEIRYATSRNFLGTPVYTEARAFLERPAAEAVARASAKLHAQGYGLLIYDAYRPWYVTKIFWDATPADKKKFVADPAEGSRHNRGCAVDLTLYDLKTGRAVAMPGEYDEMSERSYSTYAGGTSLERAHREVLRAAMQAEGFEVYPFEWWHFDFHGWQKYPILNLTFEQLERSPSFNSHEPLQDSR
ncbi:MAG: M15 family metallopeptidase [Acidobacteriota bacterium]|nr:M15 family metallopeptidase [Acidobacteriota bacterium]